MKCKLESKSKALVILSQDLVEVKRERDEYKLMAEQIRDRYHGLKKMVKDFQPNLKGVSSSSNHPLLSTHLSLVEQIASNTPLAHVLLELTEQNKYLLFEVEELKTKLIDAEGDLKLMREQLRAQYQGDMSFSPSSHHHHRVTFSNNSGLEPTSPSHRRNSRTMEEVVAQLEAFRNRVSLMERDLQVILDEKEELILSRDSYKRKAERLNRKLNDILRSPVNTHTDSNLSVVPGKSSTSPVPIDIDSLERENSFLKDKLRQMEEEKKLNSLMLTKYKSLLEKSQSTKRSLLSSVISSSSSSSNQDKRNQGSLVNGFPSGSGTTTVDNSLFPTNVISSRQIQQFIASNGLNHLEVSSASITHLRSLILALFEALCDKNSALTLHRKNNKLLGRRITELEDKLRQMTTEKVLMLTKSDHVYKPHDLQAIESVDEPDPSEQLNNEEDLDTTTDSDAGQEIAIPADLQEESPEESESDVSTIKVQVQNYSGV